MALKRLNLNSIEKVCKNKNSGKLHKKYEQ